MSSLLVIIIIIIIVHTTWDYILKTKWLFVRSRTNSSVLFVRHTHVIVEFTGSKRSHYIHVIRSGNYTWPSNCVPSQRCCVKVMSLRVLRSYLTKSPILNELSVYNYTSEDLDLLLRQQSVKKDFI